MNWSRSILMLLRAGTNDRPDADLLLLHIKLLLNNSHICVEDFDRYDIVFFSLICKLFVHMLKSNLEEASEAKGLAK